VDGVAILGTNATGNRVLGNFIGFNNVNGLISILPNRDGVSIRSSNNTIGGTTEATRNVISTNARHGVSIFGFDESGNPIDVLGNRVLGNYIGTVGGVDDFGNTFAGILI